MLHNAKTCIYTPPIISGGIRAVLCLSYHAQSFGMRQTPTDRSGSAELQGKEFKCRQPYWWVCLCCWAAPFPTHFKGRILNYWMVLTLNLSWASSLYVK